MTNTLNLESFYEDIMTVLRTHRVVPTTFGISMVLLEKDFERLAIQYPNYVHNHIILISMKSDDFQWYIQIKRQWSPSPEMITKPPE